MTPTIRSETPQARLLNASVHYVLLDISIKVHGHTNNDST